MTPGEYGEPWMATEYGRFLGGAQCTLFGHKEADEPWPEGDPRYIPFEAAACKDGAGLRSMGAHLERDERPAPGACHRVQRGCSASLYSRLRHTARWEDLYSLPKSQDRDRWRG